MSVIRRQLFPTIKLFQHLEYFSKLRCYGDHAIINQSLTSQGIKGSRSYCDVVEQTEAEEIAVNQSTEQPRIWNILKPEQKLNEEEFISTIKNADSLQQLDSKEIVWMLQRFPELTITRRSQFELLNLILSRISQKGEGEIPFDNRLAITLGTIVQKIEPKMDETVINKFVDKIIDEIPSLGIKGLHGLIRFIDVYNVRNVKLMEQFSNSTVSMAQEMELDEVIDFMYRLAWKKIGDPALYRAISKRGLELSYNMSKDHLCKMMWALSQTSFRDEDVISKYCRMVKAFSSGLEERQAVILINAVGTIGYVDRKVLRLLVASVLYKMYNLQPHQLAQVSTSLANCNYYHHSFYDQLPSVLTQDKIQKLNMNDIKYFAWSLAKIRFWNSELWQNVGQQVNSKIPEYNMAELRTILWSFAQFDAMDFIDTQQVTQILSQNFKIAKSHADIMVSSWALASCGKWNQTFWYEFNQALNRISTDNLDGIALTQLLQINALARADGIDFVKFPEELIANIQQRTTQQQETMNQGTNFERQVLDALRELEYLPRSHVNALYGLYKIDVEIQVDDQKVAIECDGPIHFSDNRPHQPMKSVEVRNKVLQSEGWKVVSIPFFEWEVAFNTGSQVKYLQQIIQNPEDRSFVGPLNPPRIQRTVRSYHENFKTGPVRSDQFSKSHQMVDVGHDDALRRYQNKSPQLMSIIRQGGNSRDFVDFVIANRWCLDHVALTRAMGHVPYITYSRQGQVTVLNCLDEVVAKRIQSADCALLNTLAWAHVRCDFVPEPHLLLKIMQGVNDKAKVFDAKAIINILSFCSKSKQHDQQLFHQFAETLVQSNQELQAKNYAYIVTIYSKFGQFNQKLFDVACKMVSDNLLQLQPKTLTNFLLSNATINNKHDLLFNSVAEITKLDRMQFSARDVSVLVWSYSALGYHDTELYSIFANQAKSQLDKCTVEDLHRLTYAFGRAGFYDKELIQNLIIQLNDILKQLGAMDISNIVWSLGRLRHRDDQFMENLGKEIKNIVKRINVLDMQKIVGSFATLDVAMYLKNCEQELTQFAVNYMREVTSNDLVNISWGFSGMNVQNEKLWNAVNEKFLFIDWDSFSESELHKIYLLQKTNPQLTLRDVFWQKCETAFEKWENNQSSGKIFDDFIEIAEKCGYKQQKGVIEGFKCVQIAGVGKGGQDVIVFLDGPQNYTANEPFMPLMFVKLRDQIVKQIGQQSITIPWHEWQEVGTAHKIDYLKQQLDNVECANVDSIKSQKTEAIQDKKVEDLQSVRQAVEEQSIAIEQSKSFQVQDLQGTRIEKADSELSSSKTQSSANIHPEKENNDIHQQTAASSSEQVHQNFVNGVGSSSQQVTQQSTTQQSTDLSHQKQNTTQAKKEEAGALTCKSQEQDGIQQQFQKLSTQPRYLDKSKEFVNQIQRNPSQFRQLLDRYGSEITPEGFLYGLASSLKRGGEKEAKLMAFTQLLLARQNDLFTADAVRTTASNYTANRINLDKGVLSQLIFLTEQKGLGGHSNLLALLAQLSTLHDPSQQNMKSIERQIFQHVDQMDKTNTIKTLFWMSQLGKDGQISREVVWKLLQHLESLGQGRANSPLQVADYSVIVRSLATGIGKLLGEFSRQIMQHLVFKIDQLNTPQLAQTLLALGKLNCGDRILRVSAQICAEKMEGMDVKELAEVVDMIVKAQQYNSKLFENLCQLVKNKQKELSTQTVRDFVSVIARARHYDPDFFKIIYEERLGGENAQNLQAYDHKQILWAYSRMQLLHHSNVDVDMHVRHLTQKMDDLNAQQLAIVGWVLGGLGRFDLKEFWTPFSERMNNDYKDLPDLDLLALHKVAILANFEDSQNALDLSPLVMKACRNAYSQQARDTDRISLFHKLVTKTLKEVGYKPIGNKMLHIHKLMLDIGVESGDKLVAVECDGPTHFMANQNDVMEFKTQVRNRMLRAAGCVVLSIPWYEWQEQENQGTQRQYIRTRMQQALGLTPEQEQQLQSSTALLSSYPSSSSQTDEKEQQQQGQLEIAFQSPSPPTPIQISPTTINDALQITMNQIPETVIRQFLLQHGPCLSESLINEILNQLVEVKGKLTAKHAIIDSLLKFQLTKPDLSSDSFNSIMKVVGDCAYKSSTPQLTSLVKQRYSELSLNGLLGAMKFYAQASTCKSTPKDALKSAIQNNLKEIDENQTVNILQQMACINWQDEQICQNLCEKLHQDVSLLSLQQLTQLITSLQKLNHRDELLLTLIIDQFKRQVTRLTFGDVEQVMRAMANLKYQDLSFQVRLIDVAREKVQEGNKQQFMQMLESLANLNIYDQELVGKIAINIVPFIPSLSLYELTEVARSLSNLRHYCDELISTIDKTAVQNLHSMSPRFVSKLLTAYCRLNCSHSQINTEPYLKHVKSNFNYYSHSQLISVCYQFAIMNQWDSEFWTMANEKLQSVDCYQVESSLPKLLRTQKLAEMKGVKEFDLPLDVRKEARKSWLELTKNNIASSWQLRVYNAVTELGYENAVLGHKTGDGLMETDVMIEVDGKKLAIEADGPEHFTSNFPCYITDKTLVRNQLLEHQGYTVVSLPFYEWKLHQMKEEYLQYLKKKIQQALEN